MAIKDANVLNKINALNKNLEKAEDGDVATIEENISKRLFNVLEGSNSISVDSELYASINDVANASDLNNRITAITLPTTPITVNGTNIVNTYTGTGVLPHTNVTETQDSINKITNSESDLTSLETTIISNLKTRFNENITKLRDIADEQHAFLGVVRGETMIQNDLNNYGGLKSRINDILRILLKIIDEHNKSGGPNAGKLANYKTQFDALDKTGIPTTYQTILDINNSGAITTLQGHYITLLNNTNNRISALGHEKNLRTYIDGLTKAEIHIPDGFLPFTDADTVASEGTDETTTRGYMTYFEDRKTYLANLQGQIAKIKSRYTENKDKLNKILQLQKLQERLNTAHPGEMDIRQNELQAISDILYSNLLLGPNITGRPRTATYQPNLPNSTVTLGCPSTTIPLNFIHGAALTRPGRFDYTLCDSNGNPLRINGGNFEYQLGTQTIALGGITFQNNNIANQTMTINDLHVTPSEGLNFPLSLDLNVRVRIHDNDTGLDIDHHKPIHLEITRPILVQADREVAYDSLTPPMNDRISAEYSDEYRENIENEAIWKILREGGNETEVNEIYNNETRRRQLQDRIRRLLITDFPGNALSLADLQTGFRIDMTRENRNVPVQYLLNITAFTDYVRNSIPNNLKEYASTAIYNNINTGIRREILQELIRFQTDIANNRVDNFDNLVALSRVPGDDEGPESHPNTGLQRMFRRGSRKNNYTKFFEGREASLDDLSLETEKGIIKYGVHVEITGVNSVTATIKIDGKDEPEIIDAANHDRLIKGILNMANTSDGEPLNRKLRCNIALSVLKAMIMMSPKTLRRQIPPRNFTDNRGNIVSCDRLEAHVRNGNLVIRGGVVNPATGVGGPNPSGRTRRNVEIFNEESFKNLHDVNQLCDGIQELSRQINSIMNATAQEYNEATNRILRNKSLRKYNTTQFLRFGPVKRLWGRMVHGKTNTDFNFSTSVNEAGKDVKISFNKGKFTVAGNFDGQQYEYKAKDLGSILRKKINRKRVFDGVELAMVGAINEEFIKKLRTNSLVQTENFAVADLDENKTGRIYIFDSRGNLSYLDIEDRNLNPLTTGNAGRIDPDAIPPERRRCSEQERKEFMQNPFLAGRLQRAMRRRLALF